MCCATGTPSGKSILSPSARSASPSSRRTRPVSAGGVTSPRGTNAATTPAGAKPSPTLGSPSPTLPQQKAARIASRTAKGATGHDGVDGGAATDAEAATPAEARGSSSAARVSRSSGAVRVPVNADGATPDASTAADGSGTEHPWRNDPEYLRVVTPFRNDPERVVKDLEGALGGDVAAVLAHRGWLGVAVVAAGFVVAAAA